MVFGLEEGSVFAGRYRVVRRLAAGAMGVVYEVVHVQTERRRALKIMHPHIAPRSELRERFALEARVTAQIASEHLVDVFDAGVDDATGVPFLVMELLRGEEVGRCLRRAGRFSAEEALACLHQTARALERTHAASIVHRDLKPGNLFLALGPDGEPRVKVLDFGVAKLVAESAGAPGTTGALGTPLYMAPEQFRGLRVSPATDVYALGMIAFTLLTGEAYWAAEKRADDNLVAFALHAAYGPREAPSARAAGLPAGFDGWFARASAPAPEERFPSARAAVEALAAALGVADLDACRLPRPDVAAESGATVPGSDAAGSTRPGAATGTATATTIGGTNRAPALGLLPTEPGSSGAGASVPLAGPARPPRRLATGVLAAVGAAALIVASTRSPRSPAPASSAPPLASPAAVLACPPLAAAGVAEPAGWLGAAAAATVCERARVILGGAAARTLVPAELLGLPAAPIDSFPVDPYGDPGARPRALDAARRRAAAHVDGEVTAEASGLRVSLVLRRADGVELARGSGTARALHAAVRAAMEPLLGAALIPQADALDPAVAAWTGAPRLEHALALLDATLATAQNAGDLADACARVSALPAAAGAAIPVGRWLCAFTLGQPLPEVPLARAPAPASEAPAAFTARVRAAHMIAGKDAPGAAAALEQLFAREPSAVGRSVLAATASCLLQSTDPRRAQELAFLGVQSDPKNPLGELCAPWGQLVAMTRDTPSAESTTRAMQAWAPWDSSGWTMEAVGGADAERALAYARRSYVLSPLDTNVADVLADKLLARGAREEVRNLALALPQGGFPVHRLESDLLLVRVDAGLGRFGAALRRAERAMAIAPGDAGWVRVQRLEVAWRAVEIGLVLGRAAAIADLVVERFVDPEPPPLEGAYVSVSLRVPALCARASPAVSRRCFARWKALRERLSGGLVGEAEAFAEGAERWARGDFAGAARAFRPLLRAPGVFAGLLPDAMEATFERTGDPDLVARVEATALAGPGELNGASLGQVRAARRAAKRGDKERARALGRQVIEAWQVADEPVPAVEEMRRLLAALR